MMATNKASLPSRSLSASGDGAGLSATLTAFAAAAANDSGVSFTSESSIPEADVQKDTADLTTANKAMESSVVNREDSGLGLRRSSVKDAGDAVNGDKVDDRPAETKARPQEGPEADGVANVPEKDSDLDSDDSRSRLSYVLPKVPKIAYLNEFRSLATKDILHTNHARTPFQTNTVEDLSVLEVYTTYNTTATYYSPSLPIHSLGSERVVINSPAIIKALQSVVEYYPGANLIGEPVTIYSPYAVLMHHRRDLARYREKFAPPPVEVRAKPAVDLNGHTDNAGVKPLSRTGTFREGEDLTDEDARICEKEIHSKREREAKVHKFSSYDGIDPKSVEGLTEHQYILCHRRVFGFGLKTLRWEFLDIHCMSFPKFDTGRIRTLVAPEETKRMLKAVAKSFLRQSEERQGQQSSWTTDFIQVKGRGQIILMHGPPGVGKTFTAECIGEFVQRPVISLASGDIGVEAANVEDNLRRWFERAQDWGAVLLIDEADVYLERRVTQDLGRNALVSVLLRILEYYSGLLVLTTNRIGAFDDAFVSRIHVVLHYPALKDSQRQEIWRSFFAKLQKERGDAIRIPIETKEYAMKSSDVQGLNWNGREIRNAFQTAIALAEFDAEEEPDRKEDGLILVEEEHLSRVVRMSRSFQDYLESLHGGSEAKRAERQRAYKA